MTPVPSPASPSALEGKDVPAGTPPPRPPRPTAGALLGLARLSHDLRYRRRRFRQAAGGLLAVTLAVLSTPRPGWFAAGVGLAALGFLVRLWAAGHVHKNAELAREGPYALVRHPLYTGNLLLGLGFALASGWIWALPLTALVFFAFYPDAVRYEDAKLERLFGAPWREWAASTPARRHISTKTSDTAGSSSTRRTGAPSTGYSRTSTCWRGCAVSSRSAATGRRPRSAS